jgi:hypothetical protein
MPSLQQRFTTEIEPKDPTFKSAPVALRKRYFDAVGMVVLKELAKQLGKGIGANGRQMKARIQPVLADGADGPVMEPHYEMSRVITLADYAATDRGITLFWHAGTGHATARRARKKGKKATPFGTILGYHADGLVRGAPIRDVRLCAARRSNVQKAGEAIWRGLRPPEKPAPKPKPRPKPPAPSPAPAPKRGPIPAGRGPHVIDTRDFRSVLPPKGTPAPPPVGTEATIAGIRFGRDPNAVRRGYRIIRVDAAKLRAALATAEPGYHVGAGGVGPSAKPGAYAGAVDFLATSKAAGLVVHAPRVFLDAAGNPTVDDGRHRLAALTDQGLKSVPVAVPQKQLKAFLARFGSP